MRYLVFIGFYLCCAIGFAQESEVSFVIKNFGVNVDGHFNRYEIEIVQDDRGLITDVIGKVFVSTIETGIEIRDDHLLEEDYFDALNFPEISLESTSIQPLSNAEYKITANLSIKGIRKPITFKALLLEDAEGSRFQTAFEINRRDFKVGGGGVLGKTVKINVIYYLEP
jgi:polyisoprenoid-binding protein YceI